MLKPNNELSFAMADIYPNYGGVDTSTLATPDADDQQALNENTEVAEKATANSPTKKKNIFLALGVLLALIVFFGGGK